MTRAEKATGDTMVAQTTKQATTTRVERGYYKAAKATNQMLPGEILDREAFCKRFGTTRQQVQTWVRQGLKLRQLGKRRFIRAEDFSEFLATLDCGASDASNTTNP